MALDRREQAKQQARINQLTEDNLLIRKRLQELESDSVGLADSLLDSLKEIQGIQIKRSTFDSNLLKVNPLNQPSVEFIKIQTRKNLQ